MPGDLLDPKTGKVVCFKEINVCSDTEDNARIKAYRPKYDSDNKLSKDWKLERSLPTNIS